MLDFSDPNSIIKFFISVGAIIVLISLLGTFSSIKDVIDNSSLNVSNTDDSQPHSETFTSIPMSNYQSGMNVNCGGSNSWVMR